MPSVILVCKDGVEVSKPIIRLRIIENLRKISASQAIVLLRFYKSGSPSGLSGPNKTNSPPTHNFHLPHWSIIMKTCIATTTSLNISIKAQKALLSAGIYSKIVSLDPSMTPKGCAYGIEFSCFDERAVRSILRASGIYPSQYLTDIQGKPL